MIIDSTADGNLMLIDVSQNKIECQTKATFVPTLLSLHPDQTLGMYICIILNLYGYLFLKLDIMEQPVLILLMDKSCNFLAKTKIQY